MTLDALHGLITDYGYLAVFLGVAIESSGAPFPGETILLSAAIVAGADAASGGTLHIAGVIAAAAGGAIVGDNLGYWAGRVFGFPLLLRYRSVLRLDDARLKLGQYLFARHGGKIVFFGRFVAFLRAFAAILAGVNRLSFGRFFVYNAAGGICWAGVIGLLGYALGEQARRLTGPIGLAGLAAAVAIFTFGWRFYKKNEARLIAEAEKASPGPLQT